MMHSDLVEHLRSFTKEEQYRFELLLQSPYFTEEKDTSKELVLVRYVFYALSQQEQNVIALLDREIVYATLHPERPFNANTLKNLTTSVLAFVRQFIEMEMVKRTIRPTSTHTRLTDFYREKGETKLALQYLKRLERTHSANDSKDLQDFFHEWEAEYAKSLLMVLQTDIKNDANTMESLKSLDVYYWARRLDILISVFNYQAMAPILSPEEVESVFREVERELEKPWLMNPLFQMHVKALRFLYATGKQAEDYFSEYMDALFTHEKEFSPYYLKRFEFLAYNFCVRNYMKPQYKEMLLDLFQRRLLPARQKSKELIPAHEYLSIVKTGILSSQFDFVKAFIEMYRYRIIGLQSSEEYYNLMLAFYYFSKNEISKARGIILPLLFHDNFCKYFSKLLEIKIFYEGGVTDYDLFVSRMNNLRMAIARETNMAQEKLTGHDNFVKFMFRLHRIRGKNKLDAERLQELLRDIEKERDISERIWLTQKINDLLPPVSPTVE